jgi:hypothetical protein
MRHHDTGNTRAQTRTRGLMEGHEAEKKRDNKINVNGLYRIRSVFCPQKQKALNEGPDLKVRWSVPREDADWSLGERTLAASFLGKINGPRLCSPRESRVGWTGASSLFIGWEYKIPPRTPPPTLSFTQPPTVRVPLK